MSEIVQAITVLIGTPLQSLLIVTALVVGIYWFIKERPKEEAAKIENGKSRDKVTQNLIDALNEQRIMVAQNVSSLDKLTEQNLRVIENNTAALQSTLTNVEIFAKTIADKMQQDENHMQFYKESQNEIIRMLHDIKVSLALLESQSR